ncbi:MAG TPA: RING finger protein, partial [Planctomycetota bacterium]|nr:RING finger protein [Planctomycetota bacterium]
MRREGNEAREILGALAPRIGAPARLTGEATLPFDRRGFPAAVAIRPGMRHNVEIAFHLQGEEGGWLTVSSIGLRRALLEEIGFPDFQVGDAEFDNRLEVWGSDEAWALKWLRTDIRRLILQIERRWVFFLRLTPEQFVVQAAIRPAELNPVETLVGVSFQILDLLDLPSPADFILSKVTEVLDEQTRCPVCGSPLSRGRLVRCAKCGAIHHAECWLFNGLCATFACGCREKKAA